MLLVVKFRNQIHRLNPALQVDMRNTRINGVARGCYGYITDPATGLVIEVDTEESCCVRERGKPGMIYRGVWKNGEGRFVTGVNQWSNEDTIAREIVQAFREPERSGLWRRIR